MKIICIVLSLITVSATACPQLMIERGWVREPPPNTTTAAGYMTLYNAGSKPLTIDNISSSNFAHTMLHETKIKDSIAQMTMISSLTLAAGERKTLRPGGIHLMLMQSARAVHAGDKVPVIFECGDTSKSTALLVKKDLP